MDNYLSNPKQMFVVIALLSCITSYAKPDYNLPLFGFAYLMWDIDVIIIQNLHNQNNKENEEKENIDKIQSQKTKFFYMIVFSWIIDIIWIIYWWPLRNEQIFNFRWAHIIQMTTIILSMIICVLKMVAIFVCVQIEKECRQACYPEKLYENIKDIFKVNEE